MNTLTTNEMSKINAGQWTFADYTDYTTKGAWSCGVAGLVGGAITGAGALVSGAAGFAGGYVGGAVEWAYDSAMGR